MRRDTVGATVHRRRAAALVGVALVLALAACGGGSSSGGSGTGGKVKLSFQWWGNDNRAKATQAAVDRYRSLHPDITIETSYAPDTNYWEKMATQVAGGNTPDVFQMKLEYLKDYSARGVIADLTADVSGSTPAIDTSKMQAQYLASGRIGDQVYGVPTGRSTQTFVYDPVQWQKYGLATPAADWSWQDLVADGEKVKSASGGKVAVMSDPGNYWSWFETWLLQRGKSLYTADGKLNFEQQDLQDYWTFTSTQAAQGIFTPAAVTTANDWTIANSPLVKKASISELANVSLAGAYFQSLGTVKLTTIPADVGAKSRGSYAGATQLLVIGKNSKHQKEAAAFVNWFLNDPQAGKDLSLTRGLPINSDILTQLAPAFTGGDQATYQFEQAMTGKLVAKPPVAPAGGAQSVTDFASAYDTVIFKKASVADAAKAMFSTFQENIKG